MTPIRVLIVDDSRTMQLVMAQKLSAEPDIEVIGFAGTALEAREKIKVMNPDVITLDVEMPEMNGIEFLRRIMKLRPMPVVMVSTLTEKSSEITIAALEIGAVDCVAKPKGDGTEGFVGLVDAIRGAARAEVRSAVTPQAPQVKHVEMYAPGQFLVAVGSSTGGVEALQTILMNLPPNCPPILIAQHMPGKFTKTLASRLDKLCAPRISEAQDGDLVRPGTVYIAPGGDAHLEIDGGELPVCRLRPTNPVNGHRPSVDVLFESVARYRGARSVGVILTGMGRDGAEGLLKMRQAGALTFGQDEGSCVVYGMPKAAKSLGAVQRELPIHLIASEILNSTNSHKTGGVL
jgi:two-component system, chemotaxis family, protein-glutamate methylesterase/glutaminase